MPHSPEGVWGKTVWSSSVMMMCSPQSVLIQNTARTVGTFLTLCSAWVRLHLENSAYFWAPQLWWCILPFPQDCFWLLELLLGIWLLCRELGSEASLDHAGNCCMAKVKAALTIPGTPGAWLRWRMGVGVLSHPWQPWSIPYLNHNLRGTVPLLVEFWKLQ